MVVDVMRMALDVRIRSLVDVAKLNARHCLIDICKLGLEPADAWQEL